MMKKDKNLTQTTHTHAMHTHIYTHTCIQTHACTQTCMHTHTHTNTHLCGHQNIFLLQLLHSGYPVSNIHYQLSLHSITDHTWTYSAGACQKNGLSEANSFNLSKLSVRVALNRSVCLLEGRALKMTSKSLSKLASRSLSASSKTRNWTLLKDIVSVF